MDHCSKLHHTCKMMRESRHGQRYMIVPLMIFKLLMIAGHLLAAHCSPVQKLLDK
jgi:hypothetical protein